MGQARIIFTDDNEITTIDVVDNVDSISDLINGGGGGGGSDLIHQAQVVLTNAQIKTLPTTPITLVAAPGATNILLPVFGVACSHIAAVYTAIDANSSIEIWNGADGNLELGPILNDSTDFFTQVTSLLATDVGDYVIPLSAAQGWSPDFAITTPPAQASTGNLNASLVIQGFNHGVNFTGGNAANTLLVSVAYMIMNAVTGVFS